MWTVGAQRRDDALGEGGPPFQTAARHRRPGRPRRRAATGGTGARGLGRRAGRAAVGPVPPASIACVGLASLWRSGGAAGGASGAVGRGPAPEGQDGHIDHVCAQVVGGAARRVEGGEVVVACRRGVGNRMCVGRGGGEEGEGRGTWGGLG